MLIFKLEGVFQHPTEFQTAAFRHVVSAFGALNRKWETGEGEAQPFLATLFSADWPARLLFELKQKTYPSAKSFHRLSCISLGAQKELDLLANNMRVRDDKIGRG